uniref:PiggyBac transposable element-derived protein domain-containing protein n=1 Tax=Glossina palpalis gambiensis TaxID=67801 RepID=A0A1B0B473_9MUSC
MWHFYNNDLLHDKSHKLFKIGEVLNYLPNKFQSVYTPQQQLWLDEAIIPRRGRLSFRTYNPAKITKYGILIWMLCEASSGYICNFKVYSGAGATLQDTPLSILNPYKGRNTNAGGKRNISHGKLPTLSLEMTSLQVNSISTNQPALNVNSRNMCPLNIYKTTQTLWQNFIFEV